MAKDKLTDYDSTASGNLDVGGISVAEGMLPSGVNNAIREQMSHLADFAAGTSGVDVLKLQDDTDTNSIKLQAPASVTATTTFTLPDGDGASGQTMITDGAGTLSWAAPYGNRNLIINGAMQVAQRGTSETGVTTGGYKQAPDRYRFEPSGIGTYTVSQSTDAPDEFSNSYKVLTTTADASPAASDYLFLRTRLEGQNLQHLSYGVSSAKTITLSFWVRSNVAGTGVVNFQHNDNTAKRYIRNYTINSADTWEYKTISVAGRTDVATDNDNGNSFEIHWWLGSGSNYTGTDNTSSGWGLPDDTARNNGGTLNINSAVNNYWQITGVQLEVGTATPFEHRSYGDELARCQRYYLRLQNDGVSLGYFGSAYNGATSVAYAMVTFPVPMRIRPTALEQNGTAAHYRIVQGTGASVALSSVPSFSSFTSPTNGGVICITGSGLTSASGSYLAQNNAAAYLGWSAEL